MIRLFSITNLVYRLSGVSMRNLETDCDELDHGADADKTEDEVARNLHVGVLRGALLHLQVVHDGEQEPDRAVRSCAQD